MLTEASTTDSKKIIKLIDGIYHEYGDSICLENADSDLLSIERNYTEERGCFWILEENNEVIGTVAVLPANEKNTIILKRMYLKKKYRGTGMSELLLNTALDWAKVMGYKKMILWSDTRFIQGHTFYEKHHFKREGSVRSMNDGNVPYKEYFFVREI